MLVLPLVGQTTTTGQPESNADVQRFKSPLLYRFYRGADGLSHVEKIELNDFDQPDIISLLAGSGTPTIHRDKPTPPGTPLAFHPGSTRRYIFNLQGHADIEFSGGKDHFESR